MQAVGFRLWEMVDDPDPRITRRTTSRAPRGAQGSSPARSTGGDDLRQPIATSRRGRSGRSRTCQAPRPRDPPPSRRARRRRRSAQGRSQAARGSLARRARLRRSALAGRTELPHRTRIAHPAHPALRPRGHGADARAAALPPRARALAPGRPPRQRSLDEDHFAEIRADQDLVLRLEDEQASTIAVSHCVRRAGWRASRTSDAARGCRASRS